MAVVMLRKTSTLKEIAKPAFLAPASCVIPVVDTSLKGKSMCYAFIKAWLIGLLKGINNVKKKKSVMSDKRNHKRTSVRY